jgi:hypothetical protein
MVFIQTHKRQSISAAMLHRELFFSVYVDQTAFFNWGRILGGVLRADVFFSLKRYLIQPTFPNLVEFEWNLLV